MKIKIILILLSMSYLVLSQSLSDSAINSIEQVKSGPETYKVSSSILDSLLDTKVAKKIEESFINTWSAILIILILVILFFAFFKSQIVELEDSISSVKNTQEKLKNEAIQLDTKLIQILEQKFEIANLQPQQTEKVDHSLPLTLGSEIHRMRKRLKTMDESQSTKVLNNRIDSLEEKLHDMGYEIVNLEGQPFDERMTLNVVNIIESEGFVQNEKKITRVIKPQIKFNDKIIQPGDIELTQGV